MAIDLLPVDFKDDIMSESMNEKRRYHMISNSNGTVSFSDATLYDQVGNYFGQKQVNQTNATINALIEALGGLNFERVTALPSDAADHPNTVYIVTEG